MLMGLWLLTSFFGNFAAGALGEDYETMAPAKYFFIIMAALGAAALVLFVLVRKIVSMMHGVRTLFLAIQPRFSETHVSAKRG